MIWVVGAAGAAVAYGLWCVAMQLSRIGDLLEEGDDL